MMKQMKVMARLLIVALLLMLAFMVAPVAASDDSIYPPHSIYLGDTAVSVKYLINFPDDAQDLVNQILTDQDLRLSDLFYQIDGEPVKNVATDDEATQGEIDAIKAALRGYYDENGHWHPIEVELEVVSVEAITKTTVAVEFNKEIEEEDQFDADQFLFYADADDLPEVGDDKGTGYVEGDSVVWNAIAAVDFDDEVFELNEEHGLAIIDEDDKVLMRYKGIFLGYLIFESAEMCVEDLDVLIATFSKPLKDGSAIGANFDVLDLDGVDQNVGFSAAAFAEVEGEEDKTTIHLTFDANQIGAGKNLQLRAHEDLEAENSAKMVLEIGARLQPFSTPPIAAVKPAVEKAEIITKKKVELTFARDVVLANGMPDVKVDGEVKPGTITFGAKVATIEFDDDQFEQGETYTIEIEADAFADNIYRNAKSDTITRTLTAEPDAGPEFADAYFVYREGDDRFGKGEFFEMPAKEADVIVDLVIEFDRPLVDVPDTVDLSNGEVKLVAWHEPNTYKSNDPTAIIDGNKVIIKHVYGGGFTLGGEHMDRDVFKADGVWEIRIDANIVTAKKFEDLALVLMLGNNLGNAAVTGEYLDPIDVFAPYIKAVTLNADGTITVWFDKPVDAAFWDADQVHMRGYENQAGHHVYAGKYRDLTKAKRTISELNGDTFTITPVPNVAFMTSFNFDLNSYNEGDLSIKAPNVVGENNRILPDNDIDLSDAKPGDLVDNFDEPEVVMVRNAQFPEIGGKDEIWHFVQNDAFNKAQLVEDITLTDELDVDRTVTIDLNGKTLADSAPCYKLTIDAEGVTVKNGKLDLICKGLTVSENADDSLFDSVSINANVQTVEVKGNTIFKDVTLTESTTLYVAAGKTLTIDDNTITIPEGVIVTTAGTGTIAGGTIDGAGKLFIDSEVTLEDVVIKCDVDADSDAEFKNVVTEKLFYGISGITITVPDTKTWTANNDVDAGSLTIVGDGKLILGADSELTGTINIDLSTVELNTLNQLGYALDGAVLTILVGPGTYGINIEIDVPGRTLTSIVKHGAVIEGYVAIRADDVTLEDFHINLSTTVNRAPVDLMDIDGVTIRGNKVEGGSDFGGISAWTGPAGVYGDVLIEGNEIIKGPIGLILKDKAANVVIRNNIMVEPGHEGIWIWQNLPAVLIIEDNTVTDAGLNDVKIVEKPISINGKTQTVPMYHQILADNDPGIKTILFQWVDPLIDADQSSLTAVDNVGSATLTFVVKDFFGNPITGLGIDQLAFGTMETRTLEWLDNTASWDVTEFSEDVDGVYTCKLIHNDPPQTRTWDAWAFCVVYGVMVKIDENVDLLISKPEVDAGNSDANWTDNLDGTGTMTLTVHDQVNNPMTGFVETDIVVEYGGTHRNLNVLEALATWDEITLDDKGDGQYEILFDRAGLISWSNGFVWTISVDGVDIHVFDIGDLSVTFT